MKRLAGLFRRGEAVALFILLSYLLAAIAWIGMARIHGSLLVATILAMTAPLVAAAVAGGATGFLPRQPKPLLALVRRAYRPSTRGLVGATLVTGTVVAGVLLTYAVGAEGSGAPRLGGWNPGLLIAGLVISFLPACAEEFGWRGFLLDRLHGLHPATAAAVVGLVWGFWHAPAIAGSGFDYGVHRVSGIAAMCLISVPFGIVLAWLRHSSGSLFAPALAHAAFNATVAPMAVGMAHANSLLAAPMGLLGAVPMAALAVWLIGSGAFEPVARLAAGPRRGPAAVAAEA